MASHMKRCLPWNNILGRYFNLFAEQSNVFDGAVPGLKSQQYFRINGDLRNFSLASAQRAKTIEISTTENKTVVEGKKFVSEKKSNLRHIKAPTGCPLCEFQDTLTYKDVLILHQFLSPDGHILPRHVTGMCGTMQWKLKNILYQSYSAGLLPDYKPELPIGEDPKTYSKDYKWRKNNVYYDDFSLENPL